MKPLAQLYKEDIYALSKEEVFEIANENNLGVDCERRCELCAEEARADLLLTAEGLRSATSSLTKNTRNPND